MGLWRNLRIAADVAIDAGLAILYATGVLRDPARPDAPSEAKTYVDYVERVSTTGDGECADLSCTCHGYIPDVRTPEQIKRDAGIASAMLNDFLATSADSDAPASGVAPEDAPRPGT